MILILGPSRPRHLYVVTCSIHGELSKQTTHEYAVGRVALHVDETDCDEPFGEVFRYSSRLWEAWCDVCGTVGRRESRAGATALIQRHMAEKVAV